jgi:signal transduction histidine kinase/ligand-binding sensor domain-containing protein
VKKVIAHSLFTITLLQTLFCQDDNIRFYNYELDLSQKTGLCALNDSRGFMWFGTLYGLNRYDGKNIKTYSYQPGKLTSNTIFSLLEDKKGDIWIGTPVGINRYNRESDDIERFQYDTSNGNLPMMENIDGIAEDREGNIWVASNTLLKFNRNNNLFTQYKPPVNQPVRENSIFGFVFEDSNRNLWYAYEQQLYLFDRKAGIFHPVDLIHGIDKKIRDDWYYLKMQEDKEGNLWVILNNAGLISFRYKDRIAESRFIGVNPNDPESLPAERVSDMLIDSKNRLWITFNEVGIAQFDLPKKKIIHYLFEANSQFGITEAGYRSAYEDKTKRIWFGGNNIGYDVIDPYFQKFIHYRHSENQNSISNDNIISFAENKKGDILIGSYGGIDIYHHRIKRFSYYQPQRGNYTFSGPQSMCFDNRGNLWCSTWFNGIFMLDSTMHIKANYTSRNTKYTIDIVCDVIADNTGNIYFGTFGGGLVIFNQHTKTWSSIVHVDGDDRSLADNSIFKLYIDKKDRLWVGTVGNGLDLMQKDSNGSIYFSHFNRDDTDTSSIAGSTIQSFLEDSKGNLWIGTNNGLSRLNRNNYTFRSWQLDDGLPSKSIMGILDDDQGNLWISTLNGLSKMNVEKEEFKNFGIPDGVQGAEFSRGACYKTKNGEMLFGGSNGFNFFHPDSIIDNPHIPPVVITDFKIFNESVKFGKNAPLKVPITEASEIRLSYKDYVFSFQFAALNFTHPQLNQYAYRMEGFEEKWNYVGARDIAMYTNLNPGNYTFHVRASNNDGIWNEQGVSVRVIISPPFWRTWWFRIIAIILIASLILIAFYLRVARIKKLNIQLENKVRERTRELDTKNRLLTAKTQEQNDTNALLEEEQKLVEEQAEELKATNSQLIASNQKLSELNSMKNKFFSIIGHDLKNPINVIMGFSEMLQIRIDSLTVEKRNTYINNIYDASKKTYSLLENLLEWARSESGRIEYNPDTLEICHLILTTMSLVNDQAMHKNITINFENRDSEFFVRCDIRMIETVIRNLLSNAIKFSLPDGKITIEFDPSFRAGFILIKISDTGIGIPEDKLESLFRIDRSYTSEGTAGETGSGLGLILCREFVEKNNGELRVESKVGVGSTFSFTLPLKA